MDTRSIAEVIVADLYINHGLNDAQFQAPEYRLRLVSSIASLLGEITDARVAEAEQHRQAAIHKFKAADGARLLSIRECNELKADVERLKTRLHKMESRVEYLTDQLTCEFCEHTCFYTPEDAELSKQDPDTEVSVEQVKLVVCGDCWDKIAREKLDLQKTVDQMLTARARNSVGRGKVSKEIL